MVLHIRFSNVTLDNYWKRDNCTRSEVSGGNMKSDEEWEDLLKAKCRKIDSWALVLNLLGTIVTNIVYFAIYM